MASAATRDDAGDEPLIDLAALERWLASQLDGAPPLEVERMGETTGVANALFRVRWGEHDLVLRRPPATKITASAGNMLRERRVLAALAGTAVRHPRLVAACEDADVIGVPFLLLERVDGFTPIDPLPAPFDTDPATRHALGMEAVDALAELATVDWRAAGLEGFGKPDGFLARQVDRWRWQLDSYRTRELALLDPLSDWLRRHLPDPGPIGIIHGDYSMFNVMFDPHPPARLAAIVDWDSATIGEPLVDLGHLLARWDEPGETPTRLGAADLADRTGLATRSELAERYAVRTGIDLTHLRYYEVLSLFKLGCIMEGYYARELAAGVPDGGRFNETAPGLFADAMRIASGDRP
jgi:aminoglycoside phosphotransferase (APT) family kinase protein